MPPQTPASSASLANMDVVVRVLGVAAAASAAYAAYAGHAVLARHNGDIGAWAVHFATGPGRTSRLLLLLFMALNAKSLPFAWTARVFGAMVRHRLWPRKPLPQQALFHYSITRSRTSLMETDYNLHKSNSTYFADLDTSRTHLVMYLMGPGVAALGRNQHTRIVLSPAGEPMPGSLGVGLGAVFCSFRKEIAPYQPYEMWSRVLAWDRKWLYVMTHFVVQGKVRPAAWDGDGAAAAGNTRAWTDADEANLQKHVIATAISKYVFKMGRFTVHPTFLMEASDLLPDRPGEGWRGGGPEAVGTPEQLDADDAADDADAGAWTWKDVERERRRGMAVAAQFAALDSAGELFNGGKNGALGLFGPG